MLTTVKLWYANPFRTRFGVIVVLCDFRLLLCCIISVFCDAVFLGFVNKKHDFKKFDIFHLNSGVFSSDGARKLER